MSIFFKWRFQKERDAYDEEGGGSLQLKSFEELVVLLFGPALSGLSYGVGFSDLLPRPGPGPGPLYVGGRSSGSYWVGHGFRIGWARIHDAASKTKRFMREREREMPLAWRGEMRWFEAGQLIASLAKPRAINRSFPFPEERIICAPCGWRLQRVNQLLSRSISSAVLYQRPSKSNQKLN